MFDEVSWSFRVSDVKCCMMSRCIAHKIYVMGIKEVEHVSEMSL